LAVAMILGCLVQRLELGHVKLKAGMGIKLDRLAVYQQKGCFKVWRAEHLVQL
jgi:hypothetical protein